MRHCRAGRHNRCSVVAWGGAPHSDTYVTNARSYVVGTRDVLRAEVWRSGAPCRWVCPCGCTPSGPERPPRTTRGCPVWAMGSAARMAAAVSCSGR
ncbi:DUF6248 family natural product biosynthesis protein [Micromonospora costi]|uniref:DUF6248 family natural product biosynthesis protein n=1 Tax=Micromonospora costi TaxID=1530042 RepID=UPI0035E8FF44